LQTLRHRHPAVAVQDIDKWSEEGGIYFTGKCISGSAQRDAMCHARVLWLELTSPQAASADSGAVPPALNAQGYYDTMWSYLMNSLQVRLLPY
jgi:hypothetical protein